ncbi:MAG: DUF4142 domain-containing protein [Thermoanaerobaculia bacterium]
MDQRDRDFMMKAGEAGKAEVILSNLAIERASNPDVKDFARRMIDDHTRNNAELEKLASDKGVSLPKDLHRKHQEVRDKLQNADGRNFDRQYMDAMLEDHRKVVDEFRTEKENVEDSDLKNFVEKTLPILESHLRNARDITDRIGVTKDASREERAR